MRTGYLTSPHYSQLTPLPLGPAATSPHYSPAKVRTDHSFLLHYTSGYLTTTSPHSSHFIPTPLYQRLPHHLLSLLKSLTQLTLYLQRPHLSPLLSLIPPATIPSSDLTTTSPHSCHSFLLPLYQRLPHHHLSPLLSLIPPATIPAATSPLSTPVTSATTHSSASIPTAHLTSPHSRAGLTSSGYSDHHSIILCIVAAIMDCTRTGSGYSIS